MNATLQFLIFLSTPAPAFNYSHKYQDFESKGEKDWLTDWHNNSRKQSGVWEAEQICGHMGWCNEKQNFLTLEPCDPLKPWNPASLFLAEFPPKPHMKFCTHTPTHNILSPASPCILADYLNPSVRAVYLGSIEKVSRVISQRLIHTDYCWGYWCPQIKAYLCLLYKLATPLERASKCRHAAWINQWINMYHNDQYWFSNWNIVLMPARLKEALRSKDMIISFSASAFLDYNSWIPLA